MKPLPSGSTLDRVKYCAASHALPPVRSKSSFALRGDAVHAYVLNKRRGVGNIDDVPEQYRSFCESINLDMIPEGEYEVACSYDTMSGVGHVGLEADMGLTPNHILGHTDIYRPVSVGENKAIYIGDLKSGIAAHVPSVSECLQTGFYALCAARSQQVETAVVEIIRVADSGFVERDSTVLDGWALDAIEAELLDLVGRVRNAQDVVESGGVPVVTTGNHCKYCPALVNCPAQMKLVRMLASEPVSLEKDIMTALTPKTAPVAYQKYRQAQEILSRIRQALYLYAEEHPIEIGNGMVLGPVSVRSARLDGETVHTVMSEMFDGAVAHKAVKLSTTKTAIRAALRPAVGPGQLLRSEKAVLEAVRNQGGLQHKETVQIRAHRPGKDVEDVDSDGSAE